MKARALAVSALSLAMLFVTNPAVSAPSSGCASVTIDITTGTATVAPGTTIGIHGQIANCSARKERYTLTVSAMSSCGQKASLATSRLAFNPNQTLIWAVSYPMPVDTCSGPWEATASVSDNGGTQTRELSGTSTSASTTITIQ